MAKPRLIGTVSGPAAPDGARLGGKQLQLLATKVVPPRCPGLIERPQLLGMAAQLAGKRLASSSARRVPARPRWRRPGRRRCGAPATRSPWLSIDRDDDGPATFLFYPGCHALRRASASLGTVALELVQESFLAIRAR